MNRTIYLLKPLGQALPEMTHRYGKPFQFVSEEQAEGEARKLAEFYPNHRCYVEPIEQTGGEVFLVAADPP
jgi:hypothetical protein